MTQPTRAHPSRLDSPCEALVHRRGFAFSVALARIERYRPAAEKKHEPPAWKSRRNSANGFIPMARPAGRSRADLKLPRGGGGRGTGPPLRGQRRGRRGLGEDPRKPRLFTESRRGIVTLPLRSDPIPPPPHAVEEARGLGVPKVASRGRLRTDAWLRSTTATLWSRSGRGAQRRLCLGLRGAQRRFIPMARPGRAVTS